MDATETREIPQARLTGSGGADPVLLGVEAEARTEGMMLDVRVRQRYGNRSEEGIEAVYTFPLPQGAVLLGLEFTLGARRLTGVVTERREAERRYEAAIDGGDTAVLLEKAAEGLYTVSVGNLLTGEDATVEVRYAQLLSFVQGAVRIAIPTVVAPRYGDPLAAGLPHHAVPEADLLSRHPARFSIELRGDLAAGEIACPSHQARVTQAEGRATVRLDGVLDRDFIVTVGGLQARPLARLARDADGWVALASFLPPAPPAPAPARGLRLKLLVDCSGSMAGDSIGQARRAAARLLERLGEQDRIDLSRFGSTVRHLYVMEAATPAHLARCHRWARELEADLGGTEMLGALREVFARGAQDDEGADVFLITDGEVHETDAIVALAQRHRQRVFVVGVGSAPNESLLQRLAARTGGAAELVTPNESIEDALMRLFARLRQPRVTGLAVDWPLAPEWTVPLPPALWSGETAHVLARFAARPAGTATLRWTEAGASRSLAVDLPATDGAPPRGDATAPPDDALPRLAAGLAVAALPDAQQGAFAERYQLVTDLTSMALVMRRDDGERAQSLPAQVKIPQMLAAGWGGHGAVVCQSARYAPASPVRSRIDAGSGADEGIPSIWRMPSSSRAVLQAFLEEPTPRRAPLEALAADLADALADAGRRRPDVAGGPSLQALRRLLPHALDQALEDAMNAPAPDAPGELQLIAWLVLELAGRHPAVRFPRAALRELRALARGVTPPRAVLDALDILAAQPVPPERLDIPAFLRRG